MNLNLISYDDLSAGKHQSLVEQTLCETGIIGIVDVPGFEKRSYDYVQSAYQFSRLPEAIKQRYSPNRDAGETEGYEFGAEHFQDEAGNWQIDNEKASFYANVPDNDKNRWPQEVDLRTPYLALGQLIFAVGKQLLSVLQLDNKVGLNHDLLRGFGRMLHYQVNNNGTQHWCGAHYDHGVLTGLMPAYYFQDGKEMPEPEDAGLYILPTGGEHFEKVPAIDKSILLFQVAQFAQLLSNDRICATKHFVKKPKNKIERFSFAMFYSADERTIVNSTSVLATDVRYTKNQAQDGSISYGKWEQASYEQYRA